MYNHVLYISDVTSAAQFPCHEAICSSPQLPTPSSQVSNIRKLQICAEDDGIQDIQPGILAMAGHGKSKKVKNPKAQGIPGVLGELRRPQLRGKVAVA